MAAPGVSLNLKVDDDEFGAALGRLLRATATLEPVFDEMGSTLVAAAQQRFLDEEDPEGNPWPELAASTRAKRGDQARILRDKGHLVQSLTHATTRFSTAAGTNSTYGRIHQLGGEAGLNQSVEIPARAYLGISTGDQAALGGILTRHMAELVR